MSSKKKIILSASCSVVILGGFLYYFSQAPQKVNSARTSYEVKSGTSTLEMADELKKHGFVRSKWMFWGLLQFDGSFVKTGFYELSPSYDVNQVVKTLTTDLKEWNVIIPEGYSINDIAEILAKKEIIKREDFLAEASNIEKYQKEFPFLLNIKSKSLEGYLFPDTYRFNFQVLPEEIVLTMLDNFDKKVRATSEEELLKQKKSLQDVIILASIVEREAKKDEERSEIAAVYLNRLSKNMKLQADPTVQYARGNWEQITQADYQNVDSPYNTYKYSGFPPGSICNPGLKSIQAVLYPNQSNYLYFFHTKDGQAIFSQTEEEHTEKVNQYLK